MLKENLVILRNIHGYSQEEIAEKINISRQAYAKWETGATVPDIEKCSLLAAVYGVTIDSLIKTETADGIGMIPPAPKGKNIWGSVTVSDRGQTKIPQRLSLHIGRAFLTIYILSLEQKNRCELSFAAMWKR